MYSSYLFTEGTPVNLDGASSIERALSLLDAELEARGAAPVELVVIGGADLIALKVYAAADSGVGRHTADLAALEATCAELVAGARWARTHDSSPAFRDMLIALLKYFGCDADGEVLSDGR